MKCGVPMERSDDGINWARSLLEDKKARRIACVEAFKAADTDGDGTLDEQEARSCLESVCERVGAHLNLDPEKVEELFALADKDDTATMEFSEFISFFRTVLASCVRQAEKAAEVAAAAKAAEEEAATIAAEAAAAAKVVVGDSAASNDAEQEEAAKAVDEAEAATEEEEAGPVLAVKAVTRAADEAGATADMMAAEVTAVEVTAAEVKAAEPEVTAVVDGSAAMGKAPGAPQMPAAALPLTLPTASELLALISSQPGGEGFLDAAELMARNEKALRRCYERFEAARAHAPHLPPWLEVE